MTDANKEAVWQRIEAERTAWRFNKYSERLRHERIQHAIRLSVWRG